jgi:predicted GH43/DUF377 family glycosyl hydrolase
MKSTRRRFLRNSAIIGAAASTARHLAMAAADESAPFRTPYKYPKLVLSATGRKGDFDQRSIDDPIVFYANGSFQMLYIGWDGIGYQTGLATSVDLLHWTRTALVAPRDPASKYTKYNLALSSILRDKQLRSRGEAIKVNGKYIGAWNAYPSAGYEEGAAVIGLATSDDLLHWQLGDPILTPQDGASWEHGGLYRPDLMLDHGTYYLYYNAKTDTLPASEGGGWREQTGVASATVRAAVPRTLLPTPSRQPSRPRRMPATAGSPRIPSSCKTDGTTPCSTTASAINAPAAPARCSPSESIPTLSSRFQKSLSIPALPAPSTKPLPTSLPSSPTKAFSITSTAR